MICGTNWAKANPKKVWVEKSGPVKIKQNVDKAGPSNVFEVGPSNNKNLEPSYHLKAHKLGPYDVGEILNMGVCEVG